MPTIHRIRQQGTILAFDRKEGTTYGSQSSLQMKQAFLDRGLNIRPLGDTVYLLPPYCITNDELARAYQGVEEVLG